MTKTNKKNDKTFLLGLGHQKCGTTWLHEYLDGYPFFEKGFAKEYHVWDYLDIKALHDQHQKRKRTLTGEKQITHFILIILSLCTLVLSTWLLILPLLTAVLANQQCKSFSDNSK